MKKTMNAAKSSELYRNINALDLPAADRAEALNAIAIAEALIGAVEYLLGLVSAPAVHSAKLKHQ
jgi:hypothetical protein